MSKLIVAVFENEQAAREGLGELQDRHEKGAITLFSNAILVKDEEGHVDIAQIADTGAEGLAAGLLLGGAMKFVTAAMLVLPGQGILTIIIGIMFINFPGKYRLERWVVLRGPVLTIINRLRHRAGHAPLIT